MRMKPPTWLWPRPTFRGGLARNEGLRRVRFTDARGGAELMHGQCPSLLLLTKGGYHSPRKNSSRKSSRSAATVFSSNTRSRGSSEYE